eukprot:gene22176-156_t
MTAVKEALNYYKELSNGFENVGFNKTDDDKYCMSTAPSHNLDYVEELLSFVVDNVFVQQDNNTILQQTVGIPMGTNCASPKRDDAKFNGFSLLTYV